MSILNNHPRIYGFFTYHGGKWRLANLYPPPTEGRITEPFAGSAGYAGKYYWLPVVLYDIDPVIYGMWDYIIKASSSEILKLPLNVSHIDELKVCQEAKWLIGMWLQHGEHRPKSTPSSWMRSGKWRVHFWGPEKRARLAHQSGLIKHWRVYNRCYTRIATRNKTTWFIDPPYQEKSSYVFRNIDYAHLASWILFALKGQRIVCEHANARWLPFTHLTNLRALSNKSFSEGVWLGY